jgi:ATP-dependent Clp protease, protease subunit
MKNFIILALLLTAFSIYGLQHQQKFFVEQPYEKKEHYSPAPTTKPLDVVNLDINILPVKKNKLDHVHLTDHNSLTFRGPVTSDSVASFSRKIMLKSASMKANDTIYVVMDTPGGSVIDGMQLIDTVTALPQDIKTITLFSASMGYQMVQNFNERLITEFGVLMSHRASGGFRGEFGGDGKGELISQLNFIIKILKKFDDIAAHRMQVDVKEYQELIRDEYWTLGQDAVNEGAADRVVKVTCDKTLLNAIDVVEMNTLFFKAKLNFSKCPLITSPINTNLSFTTKETKKYQYFIDTMFNDKRQFVKEFIINDNYKNYLQ